MLQDTESCRCRSGGKDIRQELLLIDDVISYAASAVIIAPFIGSFTGVVIRRLPAGEGFVTGRSRCDHCGATLSARDLIPILSYVLYRGRCRICGGPIGWFHIAVELAALIIALIAAETIDGPEVWIACAFGWWLLTASWIDAEHYELPDALTLPLILAGIIATYFIDRESIFSHALGAALGYGGFRLVAFLYRFIRQRDGLGEGDARLLAASGAWLGWEALPQVILVSAMTGLIFALALRVSGRQIDGVTMLPFGPFLALATWIIWIADMSPRLWDG